MTNVAPQVHEWSGNLIYNDHGVAPYWALAKLVWTHFAGDYQGHLMVNGEQWDVHLYPQDSGIAPRAQDDIDDLYEYRLVAQGEGRRNFSALIQPRFTADEMRTRDGQSISVPKDLGEAVNVRFQNSANIDLDEYPHLLPAFVQAIARDQGVYWNFEYFAGDVHRYSNITALETYVRVQREQANKLVQRGGLLHRLYELVADEKGSRVTYAVDNTGENREIIGYNHQVRLNENAARQLLSGKQHGKQFKHYHPRYVRSGDASDPLFHPKFGVLFKKGWNQGAIASFR